MPYVPDDYIKKIKRLCGSAGEKWLTLLPDQIQHYERKWDIKAQKPFSLSYNYVCPAETSDGKPAVLKISFPENSDFGTEIAALKKFSGEACISVLNEDLTGGAVLLERAIPGSSVAKVTPDADQIHIVATVLKKLHVSVENKGDLHFPTIADKTGAFDRYHKKYLNNSGPVSKRIFDLGWGIFKEFLQEKREQVLLHGDLHNDNILESKRGWLVIDPKGVIGEREFELGTFLRNPYYDLPATSDRKEIQTRRILQFSEELGFDKERIRLWALASSILSFLWSIEDSDESLSLYEKNAELIESIKFS